MTSDLILKNYQDYLEYLAKEKSDEIFTNAGKAHASILMSILLKYTRNEVRIFCEGFKPDLVTTEPYWSELNRFLEKRENPAIPTETTGYQKLLFSGKPRCFRRRIQDGSLQMRN